jgi:hypothetical protein
MPSKEWEETLRTTFKGRRGISLAEVLIACSILIVFMGACYSLVTRALQTFRMSDERIDSMTTVRIFCNMFSKDIRSGTELILPKPDAITDSSSSTNDVRISMMSSGRFMSYVFDQNESAIVQTIYEPTPCDPDHPENWVVNTTKKVAKRISSCTFTWEDRIYPQDPDVTVTNPSSLPISPQVVKVAIKSADANGVSGSGMGLWTKIRMRR